MIRLDSVIPLVFLKMSIHIHGRTFTAARRTPFRQQKLKLWLMRPDLLTDVHRTGRLERSTAILWVWIEDMLSFTCKSWQGKECSDKSREMFIELRDKEGLQIVDEAGREFVSWCWSTFFADVSFKMDGQGHICFHQCGCGEVLRGLRKGSTAAQPLFP